MFVRLGQSPVVPSENEPHQSCGATNGQVDRPFSPVVGKLVGVLYRSLLLMSDRDDGPHERLPRAVEGLMEFNQSAG